MNLWRCFVVLASVCACQAQLRIIEYEPGGRLTWTNAAASAAYRVEFTPAIGVPYTEATNLSSNTFTNSVQLNGVPAAGMGFYRVTWVDAPAAVPIGTWNYQGYESSSLAVTGLVITCHVPPSQYSMYRSMSDDWLRVSASM